LLLWTILLDGRQLWDHVKFGQIPQKRISSFEAFKRRGDELLDFACSQIIERFCESEAALALPMLHGMLTNDPDKRSLNYLLNRRPEEEK
jgi:hypothetical protein